MATPGKRAGFTLVEMLIVVAIIGVLIGLLLPAIQAAREKARMVTCTNNQQEISKAIIMYESEKGHLPAVVNRVGETDPTSQQTTWVMNIFDSMGRGDLMNAYRGGVRQYDPTNPNPPPTPTSNGCDPPLVYIEQLICPSNKQAAAPGGLSYVVNMGVYRLVQNNPNSPPTPDYSVRLFRNRACKRGASADREPHFSLVSMKTAGRTIMLSENLKAGPWTLNYTAKPPLLPDIEPGNWVAPVNWNDDLSKWAFAWPNQLALGSPGYPNQEILSTVGLSSYHGGRIVVTFCDGHTEIMPDTTKCWKLPSDPEDMPMIYGTP